MTADQLRSALVCSGHQISAELFERAVDAFTGPLGSNGLPKLDPLPVDLQVAVLTELYGDFIARVPTAT